MISERMYIGKRIIFNDDKVGGIEYEAIPNIQQQWRISFYII
jgi:hypothetical protein